ncbi:MAG: response regulator [Campylobacterota bacterium]|nr:response regulator [Campylobacterota bacterium]
MRLILLLSFFITLSVHAAYSYNMIILGTYTKKSGAISGKEWFEKRLFQDDDYRAIRYDVKPALQIVKGEKYYGLSLRPFENEAEARQLLPVVQRYRSDAFIATFTQDEAIDFSSKLSPRQIQPKKSERPLPENSIYEALPIDMLLYLSWLLIGVLVVLLLLMLKRNRNLIVDNRELQNDARVLLGTAQLKEAFYSRLDQEIRGPLNIILGYAHVLSGTKLDDKQHSHLGKIRYSVDLLSSTLDDMNKFSKIERDNIIIDSERFNLNAVLNNISTILGPIASQKGVEIIFNIDNNVPSTMMGDAPHLDEVLRNLLRFSLQQTDRGSVVMHVSRDASKKKVFSLLFEITDSSGGLDDKRLQQLFDLSMTPETLNSSESKEWGLLIAKKIIERMNGTIDVSSKSGEGTTFIFQLDLKIPKDFDLRQYRLPSKSNMYKKVLIADSNLEAAISLNKMVAYFHHNSDIVANLDAVIDKLRANDYDIIYLDAKLVEQDRKGTIHVINQNCDSKIVLVGNETLHAVQIGSDGIDMQMKKPFNYQDVFDTIVELYVDDVAQDEGIKVYTKNDLNQFAGSTILLAEDNDVNQSIIKNLLDGTGINLVIAGDGKEAIELLAKTADVSLVIMDIDMPIMDGYEAARRIREDNRYRHVPILALTAQVKPEDVERAKKAGMQEHLGKPYKMVSLYNSLYKYLMVGKYLPKQRKEEDL